MHRFYIEEKIGVSIIDIIPHCRTENALKMGKKQEMGLCFYIVKKIEYLSSIVFHTVILKMLSKNAKSRNVASFLYRGQRWSMFHGYCSTLSC